MGVSEEARVDRDKKKGGQREECEGRRVLRQKSAKGEE